METGHSCEHLLTKLWVPNHDYDPNTYSTSSSSSSVQVDLKILWQVEDELINISSDGATSIINISIVEKVAIQVPSFDYQAFMSNHTCHQMLSWVLFSMGVHPNLHDNIIREMVEFARGIRDVVSLMAMGMVLPMRARFRLVTPHVNVQPVIIENEDEDENKNEGMIPATDISIETRERETILESENCMICLEDLVGGSEVTVMPCSHVFHGTCIIRWLKQSHVCPMCRFEMPSTCDYGEMLDS